MFWQPLGFKTSAWNWSCLYLCLQFPDLQVCCRGRCRHRPCRCSGGSSAGIKTQDHISFGCAAASDDQQYKSHVDRTRRRTSEIHLVSLVSIIFIFFCFLPLFGCKPAATSSKIIEIKVVKPHSHLSMVLKSNCVTNSKPLTSVFSESTHSWCQRH